MSGENASVLAAVAFLVGLIGGLVLAEWVARRHEDDRERYRRRRR